MDYPSKIDKKGQLRILAYGYWRKAKEGRCLWCDKPFVYPTAWNQAGEYCSNACAIKGTRKIIRARGNVTKRCVICKTPFRTTKKAAWKHVTCGNPECKSEIRRRNAIARHKVEGGRFGKVE